MTESAKNIIEFLGCPCEVFEKEKDGTQIRHRYDQLQAQGKKEGFFPLIIVANDTLEETIGFIQDELGDESDAVAQWRKKTIAKMEQVDLSQYLERENGEKDGGGDELDSFAEYEGGVHSMCGYMRGDVPEEEIILAQIPAEHPWELPVWLPMGGFNDCPAPEEQAAMFRRWYEQYGAVPAVVTYDIWELAVERPVTETERAKVLASEMYGFCSDIVDQGMETLGALAGILMDSSVWYFWWD